MALLFNGVVDTQGERLDLETLGSFSFTSGTTYAIQAIGSSPCVIGSDSQDGGFLVTNVGPFNYTSDGEGLYICTQGKVSLNIEG